MGTPRRGIATKHRLRSPFLLLALAVALPAQGKPAPAPELKALEPLVGTFEGSGEMNEPNGARTKWTAVASFRWTLGGHFLREEVVFRFEGMETPFQVLGFLGWDRENERFACVSASSDGNLELQHVTLGGKGRVLVLAAKQQGPMRYLQRTSFHVTGDAMTHEVEMLLADGPSSTIAKGALTRAKVESALDLAAGSFMALPAHADVTRLCRMAGVYDVTARMPGGTGAEPVVLRATDTFRAIFGGTMLHGHTLADRYGTMQPHEAEILWGRDAEGRGTIGLSVSNAGEITAMDAAWGVDGQLVCTSKGRQRGEPCLRRAVMQFDEKGAAKEVVCHAIAGASAPTESFRANYAKKSD